MRLRLFSAAVTTRPARVRSGNRTTVPVCFGVPSLAGCSRDNNEACSRIFLFLSPLFHLHRRSFVSVSLPFAPVVCVFMMQPHRLSTSIPPSSRISRSALPRVHRCCAMSTLLLGPTHAHAEPGSCAERTYGPAIAPVHTYDRAVTSDADQASSCSGDSRTTGAQIDRHAETH